MAQEVNVVLADVTKFCDVIKMKFLSSRSVLLYVISELEMNIAGVYPVGIHVIWSQEVTDKVQ